MKTHTIHESIGMVKKYYLNRLNPRQRKFIKDMADGLDGMGEVDDIQIMDYITQGQSQFVKDIAKKFLIKAGVK